MDKCVFVVPGTGLQKNETIIDLFRIPFGVTFMIELILFFVLILFALLARFIVYGEFELLSLAAASLMPAASLVIFIISKKFANKEQAYQPENDLTEWSFYQLQKSLMIAKPLFKGSEQRGFIRRYFSEKWKYAFADLFGFDWYLSLKIKIDEALYDVRWQRGKWFSQQDQWKIYKNGDLIGKAETLITLKNSVKLKEAIQFEFSDTSFTTSAITVNSEISLTCDGAQMGTLKRKHLISGVQVFDVHEDRPEFIIALIVHSYYFKNK